MLIAIILRNNRKDQDSLLVKRRNDNHSLGKLKSWSLYIEQLDCCPVTSGDRFQ